MVEETFTKEENKELTEIYRRLKYLNKKPSDKLLTLSRPLLMKSLIKKGFVECSAKEVPRVLNFYKLTEKGKDLFSSVDYKTNINYNESEQLSNGEKIIEFKYKPKE
jgi:DNA-binding PadR family transcriptional regulator